MKFLTAEIEEFGKLEHRRFVFGEGMNLIEGENESGKSTLLAFFRFLFYGFPRRNAAGGDEREKRLSFRTRRAAGSLTFTCRGETYRIFRAVTAKNEREATETLSVTGEPEGNEIDLAGKTPGEFFLGIPAELYDSSLCVRQSELDRVGEGDVSGRVGELLSATGGAARAEKILENARRTLCYRKGRGGKIAELEDEEGELLRGMAEATENAARLGALAEEETRTRAALTRAKNALSAQHAAAEKARLRAALEQYYDLCHAEEDARGAAIRVQELEKAGQSLPDEAALARLGHLLAEKRNAEQALAGAESAISRFGPVPPRPNRQTPPSGAPARQTDTPENAPVGTNAAPVLAKDAFPKAPLREGGGARSAAGGARATADFAPSAEIHSVVAPNKSGSGTRTPAGESFAARQSRPREGELTDSDTSAASINAPLREGGGARSATGGERATADFAPSAEIHSVAAPNKNGSSTPTPAGESFAANTGATAFPQAPRRKATGLWALCAFFVLIAVGAAAMACLPLTLPFPAVALLGAAAGALAIAAVCAVAACKKAKPAPLSPAQAEAQEAYSRALSNFLDAQNVLDTEWEKTCGEPLAPYTDPDAVLREYAGMRGEHSAELAAAREAQSRAENRAFLLRGRVGNLNAETVQARLAALKSVPDLPESPEETAALAAKISAGEERLAALTREEAGLLATAKDPAELARRKEEVSARLAAARESLAALELARSALLTAETELRQDIAPALCRAAGGLFRELCGEGTGHEALHMDADFSVMLDADGTRHPLSCFSAGCRDAAYLSLRIALTGLISKEPVPLLLDEPAARLDDRRAAALLRALANLTETGGQCLLFTCHRREAALLAPLAAFERIEM